MSTKKAADEAIGKTILKQMGGSHRLQMMLGVKKFLLLPNGVASDMSKTAAATVSK